MHFIMELLLPISNWGAYFNYYNFFNQNHKTAITIIDDLVAMYMYIVNWVLELYNVLACFLTLHFPWRSINMFKLTSMFRQINHPSVAFQVFWCPLWNCKELHFVLRNCFQLYVVICFFLLGKSSNVESDYTSPIFF